MTGVRPFDVTRGLLVVVGVLHAGNAVLIGLWFGVLGGDYPSALRVLDVDQERSLPTWFSTVLLAAAAVALALVAAARRGSEERALWGILAVGAAVVSVDEVAGVHEEAGHLFGDLVPSGTSAFAWVVPAAVVAVALALRLRRPVRRLPDEVRRPLVGGLVLVTVGALLLEVVGGALYVWAGWPSLRFALVSSAEEAVEMVGFVLVLHAALAARSFAPWKTGSGSSAG